MSSERWERTKQILEDAVRLAPEQRSAYLDSVCDSDSVLRSEVESLIASYEEAGSQFLESPAAEVLDLTSDLSSSGSRTGQSLGPYKILEEIGRGGMGVVYKAEDLKLGRRVAIKFLPSELVADPRAFERFEREAQAASALDHRNICSIYQLGEHEGQPFIVMQLLEGQTLREWIGAAATLSTRQRLRTLLMLATQIADGLETAHQKGIIHRDIKPANIFITTREEAKILDFGIAKVVEVADSTTEGPSDSALMAAGNPPETSAHSNPALTQTGVSLGTPSYLSPEQIRGDKLDARTDLFSFGLVLYEAATGKRAFAGDTAGEIRGAVINQPTTPVRQINPELPMELERIISKALAKDRSQRYQSAHQLRLDLEQLQSRVAPARRPPARKWLAVGAAAGVLLIGSSYWIGRRWRFWQPATTQLTSSAIKPRRSVAVLGFKNLAGKPDEDWLSTALAEMLSAELASGQQLRTIPGENVARMKLDLSLPQADSYGRDTLNKIANHLSADLVVMGSYLALGKDSGGKVRVDLQVQDAKQGETVAVISQEGTEAELGDLVSRGGAGLRQKLGLGAIPASDAHEVLASIPANPEAARLYSEGLVKLRIFDALAARDLLQKAIAADRNHALSHLALADCWSALGYDAKAQEEAKKAFELSANLSREERLSIEGRYRELTRDFSAAIEIYRTLRNFFPDNLEYGLRLASGQVSRSLGQDALQTIARMRSLPAPQNTDARIDLLDANASNTVGDFKRMQLTAATAVARAQAQGSRLLMAEAMQQEGWAWDRLGDVDKAMKDMSGARDLAAAGGNARFSAKALSGIGTVLYDKGDFAGAQKAYEESLGIFRQVGAQRSAATTLNNLGNVFYDQGKLQDARQCYEGALRAYREIADTGGIASALGSIANVLDGLGDLTAATEMQQQSLQGFRAAGDKRGEAATLDNLGSVLLERGELNSAKQNFDQAVALGREIGYQRGVGYTLLSLAEILRLEDRLDEARATTEQAISLRRELKDEVNIARSQVRLARVALEQGNGAEAESLTRTAAGVFDKEKMTDCGCLFESVLTLSLLAQGRLTEAQAAAERATARSQQSTDRSSRLEVSIVTAEVNATSGKIADATKSLETVRAEASRYGYAVYEMEARLKLGQLEIESGKANAGKARLEKVVHDAQAKGVLLIARKAKATLSGKASFL
jgi:serine/threonine protein kinase/tetratricopeptide (TPR) repeat protein/TolB-like protein